MTEQYGAAVKTAVDGMINDLLWTEKAHFTHAGWWITLHYVLGGCATAGAAFAGGAIVAEKLPVAGGIAATVSAICAGMVTLLRPEKRSANHLLSGRRLNTLRRNVTYLRDIDLLTMSDDEMRSQLTLFTEQKAEIDDQSPQVSNLAIRMVEKRIDHGDFKQEQSYV